MASAWNAPRVPESDVFNISIAMFEKDPESITQMGKPRRPRKSKTEWKSWADMSEEAEALERQLAPQSRASHTVHIDMDSGVWEKSVNKRTKRKEKREKKWVKFQTFHECYGKGCAVSTKYAYCQSCTDAYKASLKDCEMDGCTTATNKKFCSSCYKSQRKISTA